MVSCKERGGAEWAHAEAAANARSTRKTARHLYTPSQRRVQLYSMAQPRPRFKTRQVTETSSPSRPLLRPARRPRARHPATRLRSDSARHGQVEGEGRAIRRNMRHCRASSSSLQQEIAGRDPSTLRSTFSALQQLVLLVLCTDTAFLDTTASERSRLMRRSTPAERRRCPATAPGSSRP